MDTNILVYAHRREAREHSRARELLADLAEGNEPWAIPWPCIYEFFSVVTNARIWKDVATTPSQAWRQIAAWSGSPSLRLLSENRDSLSTLQSLLQRPRVRGPIVHDARIVALCLDAGVSELFTRDRDFSLFPELPRVDPFAA
ncbi:MAG: TA system VapC family ribonuclease toxin [Polyangiaceae bacterium]|nr:TA system VapC family ribonuclease toxin [Polyangiaceae bacterium]